MDQLHGNVAKARKVLGSKGKGKGFARLVWSSVVGDSLIKYARLIRDDLNQWLELQELTQSIGNVIASTARSTPSLIGSMTLKEETGIDLDDVCCLLQTALVGRSMLILLDDVWEQDIVDRFTRLYDNDCRYLVTTRDEAIYEIAEAEKVEICKDDIKEISTEILLYHSLLSDGELPVENYRDELEEMKGMTKQEFIAHLRRRSSGFSRGASIYRGVTRHHQKGR
ncbi:AP2-like ethylene-responsive transcription factor AIL6 [Zea mays]|uniref:AP2-like ethylene-responsive transcription factor AIL6 n=2 Tax=Zea mays TaxID=4577 RepID=A0A8J8XR99_MAIZE|nr:Putative AP2/EREBP transcription factor superfamily protein [Zea mays]PWZ28910.1 AP2-like ethylene-responsive transcription factor AIL6 [Zea mays]